MPAVSRPLVPLACMSALLLSGCGQSSQSQSQAATQAPTEVAAVRTPPPDYPIKLACAGLGGKVVLKVVVGVQGKTTDVNVVDSSGQPALDAAAQQAVRGWMFNPATRNGQAVPWTIQVPVNFTPPQPRPDRCFALDAQSKHSG